MAKEFSGVFSQPSRWYFVPTMSSLDTTVDAVVGELALLGAVSTSTRDGVQRGVFVRASRRTKTAFQTLVARSVMISTSSLVLLGLRAAE